MFGNPGYSGGIIPLLDSDGKIVISNQKQAVEFIKMLNDYEIKKTYNENKFSLGGKSDEEIQDEWNNSYIKKNAEYDRNKQVLDMATHICNIVVGAGTNSPTAVVAGVFGLLQMANNLQNTDPSTRDVYNKLIDVERKLSEISDLINEKR